jgi:hypothetical protein
MALAKTIQTDSGATATYARIALVHLSYLERQATVFVQCYLDEAARRAGLRMLQEVRHDLSLDDLGADDPTRTSLYRTLKSLPEWADATDI